MIFTSYWRNIQYITYLLGASQVSITKAYLETCHTSMIVFLQKYLTEFSRQLFSHNGSIIDSWEDSKYTSALCLRQV